MKFLSLCFAFTKSHFTKLGRLLKLGNGAACLECADMSILLIVGKETSEGLGLCLGYIYFLLIFRLHLIFLLGATDSVRGRSRDRPVY